MSGVLVVAGVYTPGSAVQIFHATSEATMRPGADTEQVDTKLVDGNGNVGWDDLEINERYIVFGYVNGLPEVVLARATDGDQPQISQQAVQPVATTVGTQQAKVDDPPPEPPENADELQTGIAPGAVASLPLGNPGERLYLHIGSADAAIDPAVWELTDKQTPAETAADGSAKPSQPLYRYIGDTPDAIEPVWEAYEGAREDVPVAEPPAAPVDPAATDTADAGTAATNPADAGPSQTNETTVPDTSGATVAADGVTVTTETTTTAAPTAETPVDAAPADAPPALPVDSTDPATTTAADVAPAADEPPAATDVPIDGASTTSNVAPEQIGDTPVDPSAPPAAPADAGSGTDTTPVP